MLTLMFLKLAIYRFKYLELFKLLFFRIKRPIRKAQLGSQQAITIYQRRDSSNLKFFSCLYNTKYNQSYCLVRGGYCKRDLDKHLPRLDGALDQPRKYYRKKNIEKSIKFSPLTGCCPPRVCNLLSFTVEIKHQLGDLT